MKSLLSLLLIISLAGMATFGLALFEMAPNHQGGCLAAMDGMACPTNVVANSIHHIATLQTLATTDTATIFSFFVLLASLLLVSFLILLVIPKKWLHQQLLPLHRQVLDFSLNYSYSRRVIVSWLSLFEHSPAL